MGRERGGVGVVVSLRYMSEDSSLFVSWCMSTRGGGYVVRAQVFNGSMLGL